MKTPKSKFDISHLTIPTISKKQWDRLTAKTKRAKLALDVLAREAMGAIKPVRGDYWNPMDPKTQQAIEDGGRKYDWKNARFEDVSNPITEQSAQKLVTTQACEVCAKGACFVSFVANFNEKTVRDLEDFEGELPDEFDFFPEELWDAIEAAFENDKWSLRRVMQNIVDNKGDFVHKKLKYTDDGIKEQDKHGRWVLSDRLGASLRRAYIAGW